MHFTLRHEGELHSQSRDDYNARVRRAPEIWGIRRAIHQQLARLWHQPPITQYGLNHHFFDPINIKGHPFVPLIREASSTLAKLSILLLRPDEPGNIVNNNGDLDNRIKTLLDGLRAPLDGDNGGVPSDLPSPFYALLQDDF